MFPKNASFQILKEYYSSHINTAGPIADLIAEYALPSLAEGAEIEVKSNHRWFIAKILRVDGNLMHVEYRTSELNVHEVINPYLGGRDGRVAELYTNTTDDPMVLFWDARGIGYTLAKKRRIEH